MRETLLIKAGSVPAIYMCLSSTLLRFASSSPSQITDRTTLEKAVLPCPAEMLLRTVLLLFAAILHQSLGQDLSEGSGTSMEAQKEIVKTHNDLRKIVDPPASNMLKMTWNEKIAESAKRWANQCKLAISPNNLRSINGIFCGENIFYANYASSWSDVIKMWYKGGSNFKYGVGAIDTKKSIAGFTQIIWYNSREVGCAVVHCPDTKYPFFYVCQYCPAGNIVNLMPKPYKEGKSCGDCPNSCEDKLCTNPCKHADHITNCVQLKQLFSCNEKLLTEKCQATCNCKTEIK